MVGWGGLAGRIVEQGVAGSKSQPIGSQMEMMKLVLSSWCSCEGPVRNHGESPGTVWGTHFLVLLHAVKALGTLRGASKSQRHWW